MLSTLTAGLLVGLAAGITPGPLLTLVLSVSLRNGVKEGVKVAISPALTDLPIIIMAVLLVRSLESTTWPLGLLSLGGAGYIGCLAWKSITFAPPAEERSKRPSPMGVALIWGHRSRIKAETARLRSFKFLTTRLARGLRKNNQPPVDALKQGVLVNLLNPHPYLFWFTVGTPMIAKLWGRSPWFSVLWVAGFYIMLLGSKVILAVLFGRSRTLFNRQSFLWVQRILGLALAVFSLMLIKEGVLLLGVWD
jgi:threonine/homoserine/homoserine lactone efflux protein